MAALDALLGPWGLLIAGAIAVGLAGYEVYKHWSVVKAAFWDAMHGAQEGLDALGQFVKHWGPELLAALIAPWAMLPCEIYKHIDQIKAAAGKVAHAVARFFVGHSPIPEGPLHDLNLSRQIAMTLTPAPVITPTVQAAAAIAQPFITPPSGPLPYPLTPVALTSPLPQKSGRGTDSGRVAERGAVSITINYAPVINGPTSPDEWVKAARRHADELMRIIDAKLARRSRLEFA